MAAAPRLPDKASIQKMFPRGKAAWVNELVAAVPDLCRAHGVTNAERWRHLMAQIAAETNGLALASMRENMNFTAKRALEVYSYRIGLASRRDHRYRGWPKAHIAAAIVKDPDLLAEVVYGRRPELGNVNPGDGARFIGRGPLQTTGREWYEKLSARLGVDLVGNPELLEKPKYGIAGTFAEWELLGCNALADRGDVTVVSRRVNGGTNGLARRKAEYRRACAIWPDDWVLEDLPWTKPESPVPDVTPTVPPPPPEPKPRYSETEPELPPQLPPPGPVTPTRTAARSKSVWAGIAAFFLSVVQTFTDWVTSLFDGIASVFGMLPGMTGYVTESMAPLATLGPAMGLDVKKFTALLTGALVATFLVRHVRDKMELERRRKADEGGEDIAERDAT